MVIFESEVTFTARNCYDKKRSWCAMPTALGLQVHLLIHPPLCCRRLWNVSKRQLNSNTQSLILWDLISSFIYLPTVYLFICIPLNVLYCDKPLPSWIRELQAVEISFSIKKDHISQQHNSLLEFTEKITNRCFCKSCIANRKSHVPYPVPCITSKAVLGAHGAFPIPYIWMMCCLTGC